MAAARAGDFAAWFRWFRKGCEVMRSQAGSGGGKKPKNTVGNVSSQAGGKNSMGRRNGAPAATADGYERKMAAAKKAAGKKRG